MATNASVRSRRRLLSAAFAILNALALGLSGCITGVTESRNCRALLTPESQMPDATVGQPYARNIFPSPPNGVSTLADVQVGGTLPPGLTLRNARSTAPAHANAVDTSMFVLEGVPTTPGTYVFNLQMLAQCQFALPATSSSGLFLQPPLATVTIRVLDLTPIRITTTSLPSGVASQSYSVGLTATGGFGARTWSLASGSGPLPAGLTLSAGGVISGIPTAAGTSNFTVQVSDAASSPSTDTQDLSITINAGAALLAITTLVLPNGVEDGQYNATVQTSGGVPPLTFSISSGALPANVTLDPATGALSGLRAAGGAHSFSVQVRDSGSPQRTALQVYNILILQVTTLTLPDGFVGQAYAQTLAAIGEVPPTVWSPAPGTTLPAGFTISSSGVFSGTAAGAGQFGFCLEVTDADTPPRSDRQCYALNFTNPLPAITTLTPSTTTPGSAAFTLTVSGSGFVAGSEVRWNGAARTTTFVNGNTLTAAISAADVAVAGSAAVTVFSPAPGGGTSNSLTFTIATPPPPPPPGGSAGVTDLVSQSSTSVHANQSSAVTGLSGRLIGISRDGNRVVFASEATNLDGTERGVFVRDIALGATRAVASTLLGAPANAIVGESVAISGDGNVVAFESRAGNHVAGDTGADGDVFVVNTCIQVPPAICPSPEWISVMPDGSEPLLGASGAPSLSDSGRIVAFHSNSPLTGINTGFTQIFVRDRQMNVTTMISVDDMGNAGAGDSFYPAVSRNGRFVAFISSATNLIANDANGRVDVFLHDTCFSAPGPCTPATIRVSEATGGVEAAGGSAFDFFPPAISGDGRFVAFVSSATNLVPGDTNGVSDVFLHDRLASPVPQTSRVSINPAGNPVFGLHPTLSDDGRFVAFESAQAFVYDTCFGVATCTPASFLVSRVPNGAAANGGSDQPVISADGRFVAFRSASTNLVPGVTLPIGHIYRARAD